MTLNEKRTAERGSALLIVVVMALVLSVIGIALLTRTEVDRDIAYSAMHTRAALYAAEAGLREGERALFNAGGTTAETLLSHDASISTPSVNPQVPDFPDHPWEYDLQHLGTYLTVEGMELANREVALADVPADGPMPRTFYSLYVRNNKEDISVADGDISSDAWEDDDSTLRLVSVGWVQFGDTIHAVKILEEEYSWLGVAQNPSAQKLTDSGGTSSGKFQGS